MSYRFRAGAGALALGTALLGPIEELSHRKAWAHMVQHLLIVAAAAPLLAVPARLFCRCNLPPLAAMAAAAHGVVIATWHLSGPYDFAFAHPPVHAAEHLSLLITGVAFWSTILALVAQSQHGTAVSLLFAINLEMSLVGSLLSFAQSPWYETYRAVTTHDRALIDQQTAGAIMWGAGGVTYLGAAVVVVVNWLSGERDAVMPGHTS